MLEPKSSIRVTVSLGLAAAAPEMERYGEWIERADRALYRAKLAGRNRTVVDNPAEPVAL